MARKLASSTLLKSAVAKIAELEEKLKQQTSYTEMYTRKAKEAEDSIEQLHQVLDAVPNSIPRESGGENSWDRVKRSPITRMAAWMAGGGSHREQF